jgi:hypothetical protein
VGLWHPGAMNNIGHHSPRREYRGGFEPTGLRPR